MNRLFAPLLSLMLATPSLGQATPVWTDATKAQALIASVSGNTGDVLQTVGKLAGLLHLKPDNTAMPTIARPVFTNGAAVKLVSIDLQLAMTQLSIHVGTNNQFRVLRAQGDHRDGIILQSGFTSLRELAKTAKAQGIDGIETVDGVVHLTRPLVVWLGAGLQLEPGDKLQMDASSGAFLLGFGQVEIIGADVRAVGMSMAADAYRPFVLITGQGSLYAENSHFSALGMVGADPFGGVMVSERGLFPPKFPPALTGNTFDDVGVIGMFGVTGGIVAGNVLKAARSGGISLASVKDTQVSGNVILGTKGGAGFKLSDGSGVHVTGNLIAGGTGNGMSIGGNSKGVNISGNAVLTNTETGIATLRATCVLVTGNSIASNGASGLRLNESGVSRVEGNALVWNATSGLHVGKQNKGGRVEVSDNLLAGNRVGLTGLEIGEVVLDQNNLSAQMPRLFDGEFSQYLAAYLTQVQQHSEKSYLISSPGGQGTAAYLTACNKG